MKASATLGSLLGGRWVLGIEGSAGDVARVVERLAGFGRIDAAQVTLVLLDAETRDTDDSRATLVVAHEARGNGDGAGRVASFDVYRLQARTPVDAADRRAMLRARHESFCAAVDVVVVCGASADDARATLRMALARRKPTVWIDAGADGSDRWRLSAAPDAGSTAPGAYADAVEDLLHLRDTDAAPTWRGPLDRFFPDAAAGSDREALQAWWSWRVAPVLDADVATRSGAAARHHGPGHGEGTDARAGELLRRLGTIEAALPGRRHWWKRLAGAWHLLLSRAVIDLLVPTRHGARRYLQSTLRAWAQAFFVAGDLNANARDFAYGSLPGGTALRDAEPIARCFDLADERARVDSGRYRSATWLGYLLSVVALSMAAAGALLPEPAAVSLLQQCAGLAWASVLVALALVALHRSRQLLRRPRRDTDADLFSRTVVTIGFATLAIAWPGAALLAAWGALPFATAAELAALAAIIILVTTLWSLDSHERWLAARSLAEAVRCDHVLMPALVSGRMSRQSAFRIESTSIRLTDGLAWWLARVRAGQPLPTMRGGEPVSLCDRAYLAWYVGHLTALVVQQVDYHAERAEREHLLHHRLHGVSGLLFGLAVVSALLHLLHWPHGAGWAGVWTFCTIALPATGAGLHAINTQLETGRHAQASAEMLERLMTTRAQLEAAGRALAADNASTVPWPQVARIRRLASATADAMVGDVADWFRIVAMQPVIVPA